MNKTVRNVGGLILSIILMVSMYGTYKGGTMAVGGQTFGTMHRIAGHVLNNADMPQPASAKGPWSDHISPKSIDGLKYKIPRSAWKKGVHVQDSTPWIGGVYTLNDDGSYSTAQFDGWGPHTNLSYDQVKQDIYGGYNRTYPQSSTNKPFQNMSYDPSSNTLHLS